MSSPNNDPTEELTRRQRRMDEAFNNPGSGSVVQKGSTGESARGPQDTEEETLRIDEFGGEVSDVMNEFENLDDGNDEMDYETANEVFRIVREEPAEFATGGYDLTDEELRESGLVTEEDGFVFSSEALRFVSDYSREMLDALSEDHEDPENVYAEALDSVSQQNRGTTDPARNIKLLEMYSEGAGAPSVSEAAEALDVVENTVYQKRRNLEEAGLITETDDGHYTTTSRGEKIYGMACAIEELAGETD
ncbi:MAG: winged helix-turn-helix domain-containing protein [Candidatus Nanohaloarchaea archaeon]